VSAHVRPDLAKTYDPASVERRLYAAWEASGVFGAEPDPARPPFVISMPPPNITGRLHAGHGSTYTPMDVLTRYHRMLGEDAVWLPGQDHAAIATESVIIRELAKEGQTRESLGREAYLDRVWQWREQYGGIMNGQLRLLGFGPDWSRERFTMDDGLSKAVARAFVQLYRDGLIYRGTRLVNWDPQARSTLSDAEIENEERDGFLWHIRYPAADGSFSIEIATTRPETMLGDVAVAVHPEDERYRAYVGKLLSVPLAGRSIPVIADASVEREFGTGAVKVTPAHDPADYELGERHALPMPTVIDYDGRICAPVFRTKERPELIAAEACVGERIAAYVGLDRFEARKRIVSDLESAGALARVEPRRVPVPISERSGAIVEPLLSLQWFCRMRPLAQPALAAYHDGRITFAPARAGKTYEQWLVNIKDWCVSRQIWWGHRLPVWYGPDGHPIVAETEAEARQLARAHYGHEKELVRDGDTLDTWFSSGLWPFSILGWPAQTEELRAWYPNSVMITAREIIFLWVARMAMLGLHFMGDVPFRSVFITPLVFDAQGRKMSKSLGNALDPLELIEKYGADATRFSFLKQMRLESQELRFDEGVTEESRRFCNKMWQALRFIWSLEEGLPSSGVLPTHDRLTLADRWILTRLRETVERVTSALDHYEMGVAADALYEFIWFQFCDWYLESAKDDGAKDTRGAVLSYVFNAAMRLLHPMMPFVTEEIWQQLPHDGATIVTASWPDAAELPSFPEDALAFERLIAVVTKARDLRSELGLTPREKLSVAVPASLDAELQALLALHANAQVEQSVSEDRLADPLGAVVFKADTAVLRERYRRDLARLTGEVERLEQKLSNEGFVSRAKPDVVDGERRKLDGYRNELLAVRLALEGLTNQ
jgi:valyl-tRNA synthetase